MSSVSAKAGGGEAKPRPQFDDKLPLEHYARVLYHRKWLVLSIFVGIAVASAIIAYRLPEIFTSDTLILVDPQKVPEAYVKSTVTGDVRNRLGTLSQQILSATRLQKIIDTLNLYPEERKQLAREDVIALMRKNISVNLVSDFGNGQDLQAFKITYSGKEPRLVAQVTNELASLFIEENLKAREEQATGTSAFLANQLQDTRKTLEEQEAKLKDFKLKHIGEMPEQQQADLQIMGQLQSQLQLEGDALSRAEQQRSYVQSLLAHPAPPVVDLDEPEPASAKLDGQPGKPAAATASSIGAAKARLATLLMKYTDKHPEVQKLKREIEAEEAKAASVLASASQPASAPTTAQPGASQPVPAQKQDVAKNMAIPAGPVNPILQSQLQGLENEIAKHKQERQRLTKLIEGYQGKLEAIPVREQQITDLVRDYEMSKAHYAQLLDKQLSAETATQLEIRQKGERFSILDPAQPAQRPSRPNRPLIALGGSLGGLVMGLVLALCTEFLGISITAPEHLVEASGLAVLEVIPMIETQFDRNVRRRRVWWALLSAGLAATAACCVFVFYRYGM